MLIFYRMGLCDLVEKDLQGSKIGHADDRQLTQAHQATLRPVKHPLGDFQPTPIILAYRPTAKDRLYFRRSLTGHSLPKPRVPWINHFPDRGIVGLMLLTS